MLLVLTVVNRTEVQVQTDEIAKQEQSIQTDMVSGLHTGINITESTEDLLP